MKFVKYCKISSKAIKDLEPSLLEKIKIHTKKNLIKSELKKSRKVLNMGPTNISDDGESFRNGYKVMWFEYEAYKIPRIFNPLHRH